LATKIKKFAGVNPLLLKRIVENTQYLPHMADEPPRNATAKGTFFFKKH
jgi:hypothetical protein